MDEETYDMIFKLVIVGDSGVGKTGIINRYLHGTFQEQSKSTVGVEFGTKKIVVDGKNLKAQIWDTAGQERYRSITNAYYKGAKGALIVYDITNRFSFENVERWIKEIKAMGDKSIYLVLVGNKSDLEPSREVSVEEGQIKAQNNGIAFMETSAKTADNIDIVFDQLSHKVYDTYKIEDDLEDMFVQKVEIDAKNLNQTNKKDEINTKRCCSKSG